MPSIYNETMRLFRCLAVVAIAACGSSNSHQHEDAGVQPSDSAIDASVTMTDAPLAAVTPAAELVPATGQLTGGGFTMNVVVGAGMSPRPTSAGTMTIQTNSSIKP